MNSKVIFRKRKCADFELSMSSFVYTETHVFLEQFEIVVGGWLCPPRTFLSLAAGCVHVPVTSPSSLAGVASPC